MVDAFQLSAADRFIFVRHGKTDWNARGVFQGHTDVPLSSVGIAQAHEAAQRLADLIPSSIVSSPLQRATETARIVAEATGQAFVIDPGLIECDFGSFEGTSVSEQMQRRGLTRMEELANVLPPDAESWTQLRTRSIKVVQDLLESAEADLILVGHDAFLQSIAERLCGSWFTAAHGIPYRFSRARDRWTVEPV